MNKDKKEKILYLIVYGVLFLATIFFVVFGIVRGKNALMYAGILLMVPFGGIFIWQAISLAIQLKRSPSRRHYKGAKLKQPHIDPFQTYKNLTDFGEIGYVSFPNYGVKYSAKGEFACVKDLNGITGYHFAFYIKATKLVAIPRKCRHMIDKNDLFEIELAYLNGFKFCQPHYDDRDDNNIINNTGIVVDDISNLQGKTITIGCENGYSAVTIGCSADHIDDIDVGEITFEEWNDNVHRIHFKLLCRMGIDGVVSGRLNLEPNNDKRFIEPLIKLLLYNNSTIYGK